MEDYGYIRDMVSEVLEAQEDGLRRLSAVADKLANEKEDEKQEELEGWWTEEGEKRRAERKLLGLRR